MNMPAAFNDDHEQYAVVGMEQETYLCQIRLRADTCEPDEWQTVTLGTERVADAWRKQVAPRKRRQNYETRVIRQEG